MYILLSVHKVKRRPLNKVMIFERKWQRAMNLPPLFSRQMTQFETFGLPRWCCVVEEKNQCPELQVNYRFKRVVHHNIQSSFHPIHPGQLQSSHHWDWCLNWSRKPLLLIITTSNMSPMTDEERPWEEKPSKQFNRGKNIGMFGFCRCYSFLLISFIVTVYWGRDSIPITGLWECHKRQSDYLIAPLPIIDLSRKRIRSEIEQFH